MVRDYTFVRLFKSGLLFKPPVNEDPRLLRPSLKNIIIAVVAMSAATPGFTSTIYFPGIPNIVQELHATSIATTLTAALYVLFMGIAPVFWASFSDFYKVRRFWLIISIVLYIAASIVNAVISNIWGMVALRCVQAIGASSGQSIGGGVIADLYPVEQRGSAYSKFFLGWILGPILGPIVGGFLIMSDLTWRATFWLCAAYGAVVILTTFFFMPETFRDNSLWDTSTLPNTLSSDDSSTNRSVTISIRPSTPDHGDKKSAEQQKSIEDRPKKTLNPIKPFLLLRYPHIMMASLVTGLSFGGMFSIAVTMPTLFKEYYGFSSWQIGLCFVGTGVGNILGAVLNSRISDRLLLHARAKRGGLHKVEDRLTVNIWPCCLFFMPFGLLLFGWGVERHMSYWVGVIGFGIQTFAMNQVMTAVSAYLLDSAPGQGASATAVGNLIRMVLACALTLGASPMVEKVGPGYHCVFLAALCWLAAGLLLINKVYGQRIRRHYGLEQEAERIIIP